jgi:NADH:ubiquinone oxidoreductase subunit K
MSVELILNAANINLVAFSRFVSCDARGQIFALFVIALAAAAAIVGLAIVIAVYRSARTVYVDKVNLMKW